MPAEENQTPRAYIDLGRELNHLLNRRSKLTGDDTDQQGLELPTPGERGAGTNIVVLTGSPGSGKSTLALQIATRAAMQGFDSIYLSLEDHPKSIERKARTFKWDKLLYLPKEPPEEPAEQPKKVEADPDAAFTSTIDKGRQQVQANWEALKKLPIGQHIRNLPETPGVVLVASLLPRPIGASTGRPERFFVEQYAYLETLVKSAVRHFRKYKPKGAGIVVIDSLSMLTYSGQTRESLYRVFDLFRANGILAIFTVDGTPTAGNSAECLVPFDSTMADVVFSFSSKYDSAYLVHYLSVEKSRYTPECYGLHPCKISEQEGVRVLLSLHAIIAATQTPTKTPKTLAFPFGWGKKLTDYVVRDSLKRPGIVTLHGPHGTRKSIVAAHFLTHGLVGYGKKYRRDQKLKAEPAESGILIRLKDAGENSSFSKLPPYPEMGRERQKKIELVSDQCDLVKKLNTLDEKRSKFTIQAWGVKGKQWIADGKKGEAVLVVVDFNTGMLLPEEFVQTILSIFDTVDESQHRVKRVVIDDVSVIGGVSYPLLEKSETTADLFLSAFVHILRNKEVDLIMVGTRGNLDAGNRLVDRAIALADSVIETKIKDIFGDRYILLAGDGVMASETAYQEYVPPALQILDKTKTNPGLMQFNLELLRGLTGFDAPIVTRTKVYAYLFKLNDLQMRYNRTLPYLVEPLCGLPIVQPDGIHKDKVESGLHIINFDPDISDTIHRSLGVTKSAANGPPIHFPKEHTVLATIDEFDRELKQEKGAKDYTKNVILVAWRNLPGNPTSDDKGILRKTWQDLLALVNAGRRDGKKVNKVFGKIWIDRSVKESLSCCLLDCLISGWQSKGGRIKKDQEGNEELDRALKEIMATFGPGGQPELVNGMVDETTALHELFQLARQDFPKQWQDYAGLWPKPSAEEGNPLPLDADIYICWYSQLRELLAQSESVDQAEKFRVAALPGGGFRGDWKLLVLPGSVSHRLGNAVVEVLTSREEDYRRFVLGVGLPSKADWQNSQFRAWPGAVASETLQKLYMIHENAHLRSGIAQYPKITRMLSTFAQRLAGDWNCNEKPNIKSHLERLPAHIKAVRGGKA